MIILMILIIIILIIIIEDGHSGLCLIFGQSHIQAYNGRLFLNLDSRGSRRFPIDMLPLSQCCKDPSTSSSGKKQILFGKLT